MHNFTLTKKVQFNGISKKQGIKNGGQPRFEKCYSRLADWLAECHHLRQGMRSPGGHWSAESRLDLSSRPLAIRRVVSLSTRRLQEGEGGGARRASPIAKTLKGLKTTNSGRDTRGRAPESWVIIYEFGAPKKAAPKEIPWPGYRAPGRDTRKPREALYGFQIDPQTG